ncbi:MAG: glycosyltransferase family 1 protein, partial [Flavobacterium sp.]|nr:glycosyltransferase family 1 protein [Flavobacterium sp.]
MFWGCIPVSTAVSCVPDMLGNGERGILIGNDLPTDTQRLIELISNEAAYSEMSSKAVLWSQQFTQESFESEIKKLLSE